MAIFFSPFVFVTFSVDFGEAQILHCAFLRKHTEGISHVFFPGIICITKEICNHSISSVSLQILMYSVREKGDRI